MPPNGLDSAADLEAISQISAWKEGRAPDGDSNISQQTFSIPSWNRDQLQVN